MIIARLLGIILILVPVGMVIALFYYWLKKKSRRDVAVEKKLDREG